MSEFPPLASKQFARIYFISFHATNVSLTCILFGSQRTQGKLKVHQVLTMQGNKMLNYFISQFNVYPILSRNMKFNPMCFASQLATLLVIQYFEKYENPYRVKCRVVKTTNGCLPG